MEKKKTGNWGDSDNQYPGSKDPMCKGKEPTPSKALATDEDFLDIFWKNPRRCRMHRVSHMKPEVLPRPYSFKSFSYLPIPPAMATSLDPIFLLLVWHLAPSQNGPQNPFISLT